MSAFLVQVVTLAAVPIHLAGGCPQHHTTLQALLPLLQPDQPGGVRVLSLHGMGGIGKTTLARELFSRLSGGGLRFSSRLFLEVGQDAALPEKQRELIQLLTGGSAPQAATAAALAQQLRRCTRHAGPLLLVLDDVWEAPQRDALLCLDALPDGSRVVLTGRDSSRLHPDGGACAARPVEALAHVEARQLLCQHAFAADRAPPEYGAAVQQALKVCGGLPLALQVVGAGMRSRPPDAAEVRRVSRDGGQCVCMYCSAGLAGCPVETGQNIAPVLCRRTSDRCYETLTPAAGVRMSRGGP